MKTLTLILLTSLGLTLYATVPSGIDEAIKKLDYGFIDFKYNIVDDQLMNGKRLVRVSEFQPDREIQFNLQSENGESVSNWAKKRYSKDKTNIFGKDRFTLDSEFTFRKLVEADDYKLLESGSGLSRYSFTNRNSVIPESEEPLYGELILDEEKREITHVSLKNIQPMKVILGVTIDQFQLDFDFKPSDSSYCLIDEINCLIYGNVLFMDLDYTSNLYLSDYEALN